MIKRCWKSVPGKGPKRGQIQDPQKGPVLAPPLPESNFDWSINDPFWTINDSTLVEFNLNPDSHTQFGPILRPPKRTPKRAGLQNPKKGSQILNFDTYRCRAYSLTQRRALINTGLQTESTWTSAYPTTTAAHLSYRSIVDVTVSKFRYHFIRPWLIYSSLNFTSDSGLLFA